MGSNFPGYLAVGGKAVAILYLFRTEETWHWYTGQVCVLGAPRTACCRSRRSWSVANSTWTSSPITVSYCLVAVICPLSFIRPAVPAMSLQSQAFHKALSVMRMLPEGSYAPQSSCVAHSLVGSPFESIPTGTLIQEGRPGWRKQWASARYIFIGSSQALFFRRCCRRRRRHNHIVFLKALSNACLIEPLSSMPSDNKRHNSRN